MFKEPSDTFLLKYQQANNEQIKQPITQQKIHIANQNL